METNHKNLYEAPMADMLEVKNEGVICVSRGEIPGNSPYTPDDDPFSF